MGVVVVPAPFCFKKVCDTISDYFGGPLAENPDFKRVCGTILVVPYMAILFSRKYQILF